VGNEAYHIFVIDDSPIVCKIIEGTLKREGYQVFSFANGIDALRAMTSNEAPVPHLVFLDINLPVMNGFEVIHMLHQHPQSRHVPIVLVTAHHGVVNKVRSYIFGVREMIAKPFQPGQIVSVVRSVLASPAPAM
jgi:CheY-like chemotaxis protein